MWWGVALLTVFSIPTQATAQSLTEYRQYVDSLKAAHDSLGALLEQEAARAVKSDVDTISIGMLTLVPSREHSEVVRESGELAWSLIQETLRSDTTLLSGTVLYLPTAGMRQLAPENHFRVIPWSERYNSVGRLAADLIGVGGFRLLLMLDQETREWIGSQSPLEQIANGLRGDEGYEGHEELTWAYIELASSWARVGRDCLVGDLTACRWTLGIEPADDPLHQWYDADDRRKLVERRQLGAVMLPRIRTECLDEGSDEACEALLSRLSENEIPPPISLTPRQSFSLIALDLGGDGAFGRLVRSADLPLEERFSLVAGISADSLLRRWHAEVLDAAPERMSGSPWAGATSIAWVLVFIVAATRSRRWRLD